MIQFVLALARPGGNATGLSIQSSDLAGKRLELLRELTPGLRRLAILTNFDYAGAVLEAGEVQDAAQTLGLEVVILEIRRAEDIAPALDKLRGRAQGLYLPSEAIVFTNRALIATLAQDVRLVTTAVVRDYVEAGILLSYGPNYTALFRRTAEYVDKILRGTKPGDIPVEQPTKFDLVINLKTAKALGLTIPESFLVRADEVIE
jgi:putative tryptophan/tyrosine transport system substrate-binding protein